jgi:hypothetical protein
MGDNDCFTSWVDDEDESWFRGVDTYDLAVTIRMLNKRVKELEASIASQGNPDQSEVQGRSRQGEVGQGYSGQVWREEEG